MKWIFHGLKLTFLILDIKIVAKSCKEPITKMIVKLQDTKTKHRLIHQHVTTTYLPVSLIKFQSESKNH